MSEIWTGHGQTEEVPEGSTDRKSPFCVISRAAFGQYAVHDIQTNSAWSANPYGDAYAVVPDELVEAVMETGGFLEPVWSGDGTELAGFAPLDKPELPAAEEQPSLLDQIEAQVTYTAMMTDTLLEV